MNEYKEYMADKDLGCTLNEDQFNEVYKKWEYVYETGKALEQFRDASLIDGLSEKEVRDAFNMSIDEFTVLMATKGSPAYNSLFSYVVNYKERLDKGFVVGGDPVEQLNARRQKAGLKEDHTLEAIQALEEGLKTKAIPKDEDDRQMTKEEIKKAEEAEKRVAQKLKVKNAMRNKWEFINDEIAEEVKADEAKLNERFKKKQGS